MPTEKAAPHRAKKEKSRVYSFFLLSYTLILLVSLSSCLFFGAEVAQQLRREEALNKQALLTSLKNDVEENLRYVEELGNSLVFNSRLQFLVKHPSVSSVHDAMDQMAGMAVSRDFLLDYFLYVRSTDEVVTSTVRMSADKFFDIIYEFTDLTAQALREGTLAEYHFQGLSSRGRAAPVRFRHGDPRHSLRPVHPHQQQRASARTGDAPAGQRQILCACAVSSVRYGRQRLCAG